MSEIGRALADPDRRFACLGGYMGSARAGGMPVSGWSSTALPPRRSSSNVVGRLVLDVPIVVHHQDYRHARLGQRA